MTLLSVLAVALTTMAQLLLLIAIKEFMVKENRSNLMIVMLLLFVMNATQTWIKAPV